ncbi:MAG: DnaD domain protein [Bacilli bacterium]|nr:DnaD domain protein [Bacilli bacterium]
MVSKDDLVLSINDELIIALCEPLSDYRKKVLSYLYAPIVGTLGVNLYLSLFSFVDKGEFESSVIAHKTILSRLFIEDIKEFLNTRHKLEALGLLEVYVRMDNDKVTYIYQLKEVADPYDFLTDPVLEECLRGSVGNTEFDKIVSELLVHRYDIGTFKNITRKFDDVYEVTKKESTSKYQNYWVSAKNQGINLGKAHFDYECLLILVEALDLLDNETLRSVKFYDVVNKLSFMYGLSVEEMCEAIKNSVTPDRTLDYEVLNINVKYQYDSKHQMIKIKPVTIKTNTNDLLIIALENTPPKDIVENKYGTKLTSSEIEMFEKLRTTTNLPLGVLNVLIIYVISSKDGEIPSYNYFIKIANSWIRGGIMTTSMALDKISGNSPKQTRYKQPQAKKTASWYDEYLEKEKEKLARPKEESESLEDLEAFFKVKK